MISRSAALIVFVLASAGLWRAPPVARNCFRESFSLRYRCIAAPLVGRELQSQASVDHWHDEQDHRHVGTPYDIASVSKTEVSSKYWYGIGNEIYVKKFFLRRG